MLDEQASEEPVAASAPRPDLAAAVRRARLENAERSQAIADVRDLETARLQLVEQAVRPIVEQAPPGVDLFDLAISPGDPPRLFLDMIAFVEMAHDKRTYRFIQDTRDGRVTIAETPSVEWVAAAVTNYVARRLVERERALASAARAEAARPTAAERRRADVLREQAQRASAPPAAPNALVPPPVAPLQGKRTMGEAIGDVLSFILMTLGSITLILMLALGGYIAWTQSLSGVLTRWFAGGGP